MVPSFPERTLPRDSTVASTDEGQNLAGSTAIATSATTAGSSDTPPIVRQPPIDTDTETAAATNPTHDQQSVSQ